MCLWYSVYNLTINVFVIDILRPRQDGRHFPDDIFKSIFLNENVWISIKISLEFVPNWPINDIPALVQIMAWRRPGDKPLSETMMVSLPTHICVIWPQWVDRRKAVYIYKRHQQPRYRLKSIKHNTCNFIQTSFKFYKNIYIFCIWEPNSMRLSNF